MVPSRALIDPKAGMAIAGKNLTKAALLRRLKEGKEKKSKPSETKRAIEHKEEENSSEDKMTAEDIIKLLKKIQ